MLNKLQIILSKYYLPILFLEFLISPLIVSLFINLQPMMIYTIFVSAFFLFFIPGLAVTSFLQKLTIFERITISLAFGLSITAAVIFFLTKIGLPINNFVSWSLIFFSSLLIWFNKKNFYFNERNTKKYRLDLYDLLAVLIGLLAFSIMLIPISVNPVPYGDVDAGWHFFASNYIRENHKLLDKVPEFSLFYAGEKYSYPFVVHINLALFGNLFNIPQAFSPYAYVSLLHMILGFGVYTLVKRNFGKIEAIGAFAFTIVSRRLLSSMISGQWAFYTGLALLPVSIFLIINFYKEQNAKNAIFLGILFGLEAYTHPEIAVHSIIIFILYGIFWFIVNRKIPKNLYLIPILSLIAIPTFFNPQTVDFQRFMLPNNFYLWYPTGEYTGVYYGGYPFYWFNFFEANEHILYFSIVGVISWFLFFRRDYLLATLLISLFILFHLPLSENIRARLVTNEFILMVILGGISFSLLKLFLRREHIVPFSLIVILAVSLYLNYNMIKSLINYPVVGLSVDEFNLLREMRELPEGKTFYLGFYIFSNRASWAQYLSEHIFYFTDPEELNGTVTLNFQNNTKYMFLSTNRLSKNIESFVIGLDNLLVEQGCKVIKSYPTSVLLSTDCLKGNKLMLKYELL